MRAGGENVWSRVGRLLQDLKEVPDGGGKEGKGAARLENSRVVTGAVEEDVVRGVLRLHLPECPRARTLKLYVW